MSFLKKLRSLSLYSLGVLLSTLFFLFCIGFVYFSVSNISSLRDRVDVLENEASFRANAIIPCDEKKAIHRDRESVVRIVGGEAEGSGFAIKGYILTNFHVIEFDQNPKVILPDNSFTTADIVYADKDHDLAVLQIDKALPSLSFGDDNLLEQTDELYALGFPFGGDLAGELTVKKGILSGKRFSKDAGMVYLQTDSTLNPGLSGGPMVNHCGDVVGINTLGGSGLGMAIASSSIQQLWQQMQTEKLNPLRDVQVLMIQEDVDPLHTVEAFYDYIKLRKLKKAFALLGEYKKDFTYENWKKGYEKNLDTSIIDLSADPEDKNKIQVRLATKDMENGEIVYKYYEGYWIVKQVDSHYLLWNPDIKEITDPPYSWFMES
jgi:hypothetical protein